jgi:hypothetical protein
MQNLSTHAETPAISVTRKFSPDTAKYIAHKSMRITASGTIKLRQPIKNRSLPAYYNKKTARVDDPSDLTTRVDCLRARNHRDCRWSGFRPGDNLRVLIRSLGSSTRVVFCLSYTTIVKKVVPFGESCPGTHA